MQTSRKYKVNINSLESSDTIETNYNYGGSEFIQDTFGTQENKNSTNPNELNINVNYKLGVNTFDTGFLNYCLCNIKDCIKTARIYQWSKNVLIMLPAFFLSQIQVESIYNLCVGFLSLGLCASSVYFINDILDKKADSVHPTKKFRPIARGTLPILEACVVSVILLTSSLSLSYYFLNSTFSLMLGVYFGTTLIYSLVLKKIPLLDVMILAGFYTFRIFMGSVLLGISLSMWIYACSMSLFLSLALLKRTIEFQTVSKNDDSYNKRRGYLQIDKVQLSLFGVVFGEMSVVFLSLYFSSSLSFYKHYIPIFFICTGLTYWITYMWFMAGRNKIGDDPVFFATTNLSSYIILVCVFVSWIVARGFIF